MSRKRVIIDIENLDQAMKLEQTVRTGYCDPIIENLLAWIAVEEDLATSYEKLAETYSKQKSREALRELSTESTNIVKQLHKLVRSMEEFALARERRQHLIDSVMDSMHDEKL